MLRYYLQPDAGREPFVLLDGISIWPGDFLRLCVVLLAVHLVLKTLYDLEKNVRTLERKFAITDGSSNSGQSRDGTGRRKWYNSWRNFWPQTKPYDNQNKDRVDVRSWWLRYQHWGNKWRRLGRAALLTVIYFLALILLTGAFNEPWPHLPVRGTAGTWSICLLMLAVVSSLFVIFLVVDATNLNCRSIRDLNRRRTDWHLSEPGAPTAEFGFSSHLKALEDEDYADYLDIELIASRSDVINDLIYYPCVLITLLIASRWSMTDNYLWPPALLMAYGINATLTLYCAIRLPIEANKARATSLRQLRAKLFARRVAEASGPKPEPHAKSSIIALEEVIRQIEHMDRGAFVGIWEQPVLRALLVPSSSAGLWALLEFLPR